MATYIQRYNEFSGQFVGVQRDDGANIPNDPGNADWRRFLAWNVQQPTPLDLSDRPPPPRRDPRPLADIVTDIEALNSADRNRLTAAVVGSFLQQQPGFARSLGIAVDGVNP